MAKYATYPRWEQLPVPPMLKNGSSWERQIEQIWSAKGKNLTAICQFRTLNSSTFGSMRHFVLKIVDPHKVTRLGPIALRNSEDPTYEQKTWSLSCLGKWKKIALEVIPITSQLVDEANLYHLWEVEDEKVLPFSLSYIPRIPENLHKEVTAENYAVDYEIKSEENIRFLYLRSKDGKELKWRQKFDIKNKIVGPQVTAVEVISEDFLNLDYTCLVCFPKNFSFDFGLHI